MFFEWLIWTVLGFILAYMLFHWENYHRVKKEVQGKAEKMGIVQVQEEAIWAKAYRSLSWRKESRLIGGIATAKVPSIFRKPVFNTYIKLFKVDMADVHEQDLNQYSSLNEFFSRQLKPGARPIDPNACVVSPADSHIFHFGKVDECVIRDVKGFNYNLHAFFGEDIADTLRQHMEKKHTAVYYCVCYLSPSDYHRFHSPADWTITFRRHFSGRLLSVNEKVVNSVSGLFDINERVLLTGEWKYGFFSMTAVGATNVGAIELDFDTHITNKKLDERGTFVNHTYENAVNMKKGDSFGRFLFGSTLVLVFQAPASFGWAIEKGQKMQYGQAIGAIN